MEFHVAVLVQVAYGAAQLVLVGAGLAVIFGMLRVINLAHGEFLMLGAYTVVVATGLGAGIWWAMLVFAPLVVGAAGLAVERCLVRFLYGRIIDTLLATWGLGLLLAGLVTTVFGGATATVAPPPLGTARVGGYAIGGYELFLMLAAFLLLPGLYALLRLTRAGLLVRGAMDDPDTAATLGVPVPGLRAATFALGAAVAGLAGGLLAPLAGVLPTMGAAYVAKAFITVVAGGPAVLAGTASAAGLLGATGTLADFAAGPALGEVAMLFVAVLLLRLLPRGITGRFRRGA